MNRYIRIRSASRRAAARSLIAAVGTLLMLSGCASTNHVLESQADEVIHSTDTVDQVAACFEAKNRLRVIERSDGARVARFRNGYGGVVRTFSIYPEPTGSRIEVRHNAIGVPGIRWKQCVGLKHPK